MQPFLAVTLPLAWLSGLWHILLLLHGAVVGVVGLHGAMLLVALLYGKLMWVLLEASSSLCGEPGGPEDDAHLRN